MTTTTKTVTVEELPSDLKIDFIILTAVDVERDAMREHFEPLPEQKGILKVPWEDSTYYLGRCGLYACALVMCDMGSGGSHGSTLSVNSAIERFHPMGVIMVGFAFGNPATKLNPGDVAVATQLIFYEIQRVGEGRPVQRGSRPEIGHVFRDRLRNLDWTPPDGHQKPKYGPILSGDKLVDNIEFRDQLFNTFPDAIAGEMEGEGLYAASAKAGIQWALVKGICDWADGHKDKKDQPQAARNASSIVKALLSETGLEDHHFPTSPRKRVAASKPDPGQLMVFEVAKNRVRELHRIVEEKSKQLASFITPFVVDGKPKIPKEKAIEVDLIKRENAAAVEDWLNAYNDLCVQFLVGHVQREAFVDAFGLEIHQLLSPKNPHWPRLSPRDESHYQAIWKAYDRTIGQASPPVMVAAPSLDPTRKYRDALVRLAQEPGKSIWFTSPMQVEVGDQRKAFDHIKYLPQAVITSAPPEGACFYVNMTAFSYKLVTSDGEQLVFASEGPFEIPYDLLNVEPVRGSPNDQIRVSIRGRLVNFFGVWRIETP